MISIINQVSTTKNVYPSKDECCGCTACVNICSKSAIQMEADEEGFLYPKINNTLCVNCNACVRICAFQHEVKPESSGNPKAFAVRHRNTAELKLSRSGGMFVAISDYILDNSGVVYGAGFSDHFRVVHKRATTKLGRDEFRGSKYVQSEMGDCFQQVKLDLKAGKQVLFSSTPCHTAGLKAYLGTQDLSNLYICDIVCHGVPSPKIWDDYLGFIEAKFMGAIEKVNFRDKDLGWDSHYESFQVAGRKRKLIRRTYTELFYRHIMLRPSCENCKYTNLQRPSDITLADYWGWEKNCPDLNIDNAGISLVLVNSEKGRDLFDQIKQCLLYQEVKVQESMQPNMEAPTEFSNDRELFWAAYHKYGFHYIAKKYADLGAKRKIVDLLKRIKRVIGAIMNSVISK